MKPHLRSAVIKKTILELNLGELFQDIGTGKDFQAN
jgi:hypothetical protein